MTKVEAVNNFKQFILPGIINNELDRGVKRDSSMRCEAWNQYTDILCKDGAITDHQYMTWVCPPMC